MAKAAKLQGWRKIASVTWGKPDDPQIFGDLEIDASELLRFMEEARVATGQKLTITHMAGKAIAHAYAENPDLNIRLFRGRAVPRESIDVFFIVSTGGGGELSGVKIARADEKPVVQIAADLADRASRIHAGDDEQMGQTKELLDRMPRWLMRILMRLAAVLSIDLNLHLPKAGMPRQTFGSALVSSVGMFGIQHAYAPLSPYYRVPFLVLVGEVVAKPVVVKGEIVIRPILNLAATIDHRYLDGFHAARLARSVKAYCADPFAFEPPLTASEAAATADS
jgi:pyruvate/2-oxoglutarate dehydrogenase complex dihydrolipoamide acyltransferase (E2) component